MGYGLAGRIGVIGKLGVLGVIRKLGELGVIGKLGVLGVIGKMVNGKLCLPEFQGWWNRVDVMRNAGFICLMLGKE